MTNFIRRITLAVDKLTMLSLKFVSNSLRSATAVATNNIVPPVVPSTTNTTASNYNALHQTVPRQARLFTTSPSLDLGAMSDSRAHKINTGAMETDLMNLPIKPKKPIIPWLAFVRERKEQVLIQKDKMTAAELASILSKEWKQTDKSRYEREYNARREEYLKHLEAYENSLTEEHRGYLNQKKNLARETKALRELRKTRPPTLPRNAANLYCAEKTLDASIKEQLKSGNGGTVFSKMFQEYRSLSDAEKAKYLEMQKRDKTRFEQEFNKWYDSIMHEDANHSKAVKELAETMRTRFIGLGYIHK